MHRSHVFDHWYYHISFLSIQCCVASVIIICVRTMCFLLFLFCYSYCLVDTRDRFIHPFSWNYIVKVYLLTTFDKDGFTIIYLQRSNCVH